MVGFFAAGTGLLAGIAGFVLAMVGFFAAGTGLAEDLRALSLVAFNFACNSANLFALASVAAPFAGDAGTGGFFATVSGFAARAAFRAAARSAAVIGIAVLF